MRFRTFRHECGGDSGIASQALQQSDDELEDLSSVGSSDSEVLALDDLPVVDTSAATAGT